MKKQEEMKVSTPKHVRPLNLSKLSIGDSTKEGLPLAACDCDNYTQTCYGIDVPIWIEIQLCALGIISG